jgi:hypothetical protein
MSSHILAPPKAHEPSYGPSKAYQAVDLIFKFVTMLLLLGLVVILGLLYKDVSNFLKDPNMTVLLSSSYYALGAGPQAPFHVFNVPGSN